MSDNMFGFDTEAVSTELGIEAGEYPAVVNTVKKKKTKDSDKTMFVVSYKIVGNRYKDKVFDYNNYVIDGPTSVGTKLFFKLVEDCGLQKSEVRQPTDLAKLIQKPVTITVGKKNKDDKYSTVLSVDKRKEEKSEDVGF